MSLKAFVGRAGAPVRRAGALALLGAVASLVVAACGSASPSTSAPSAPGRVALPIASSVTTAKATWAVVPVGAFWELLRTPAAGASWSNVTPPGVGDSGGLVVGPAPDQSLIAGFLPSALLKFSPVERTTNGTAWTPGLLPGALAHGPDVLSAGSGGIAWAVLASGAGTVVSTSDGGSSWRGLVDERQLAATAAGRQCGTTGVTAVADVGTSSGLLGVTCARPGVVGIIEGHNAPGPDGWTLAGPRLGGALADGQARVLRLVGGTGWLFALLAITTAGSNAGPGGQGLTVIAAWSGGAGQTWHESQALPLSAGTTLADIVSAGPVGLGVPRATSLPVASVLIKRPTGSLEVEQLSATTAGWQRLPSVPARTVVVAAVAGGPLEAVAVQGQFVQIWSRDPGSAYWRRIQTILVPPGGS